MPCVREINNLDELEHLRMVWNALLVQTRHASFFQTLDWLEVYWRHFGEGQRLRVLVIYEGEEAIGIVPLTVRAETTRAGRVRVLTYPLDGWGDFYGPIGPNPTVTLRLAMRYLRREPRDWDLLELRGVDLKGCDHGRTRGAMEAASLRPHEQPWEQAAVLQIEGTWEEYWQGRSPKWRENLRRSRRRLESLGRVTYLRYRPNGAAAGDGDPRWDLWEACLEVARRSWQGSSATGTTLCHGAVEAFLRDVHEVAARLGGLDLNLLLIDGRPVAFAYNYHWRSRVFGLRMGFDPALASARPGSVLLEEMIRDGFARGDEHFDLGPGSIGCKRPWLTSLATSFRYTYYRLTVKAQLLRAKRWYTLRRHGRDYLAGAKTQPQVA